LEEVDIDVRPAIIVGLAFEAHEKLENAILLFVQLSGRFLHGGSIVGFGDGVVVVACGEDGLGRSEVFDGIETPSSAGSAGGRLEGGVDGWHPSFSSSFSSFFGEVDFKGQTITERSDRGEVCYFLFYFYLNWRRQFQPATLTQVVEEDKPNWPLWP
jgi:hypothetical protein